MDPLRINADHLPDAANHYVLWLDVMGVQSIMSRSLPISANFIFKFHSAAITAKAAGLDLYPVMDGLYATSTSQDTIRKFIRDVLVRLAGTFVGASEDRHRFLVRGGLSYGPLICGSAVQVDCAPTLAANANYASTLLLGMPIIQAHLGEGSAPPFGVFVCEAARAFCPANTRPFNEVWWSWFEPTNHALAVQLRDALLKYYDWCAANSGAILYDPQRIKDHRTRVEQHFPAS